ncbi:hypothetical protein ACOMICROBIO_LMKGKHOH_02177 [Vibrio sp. B1FIG11]|uniref:hypothetical protein n=1 Tax=Vibrio TaxID=662 RepID=UPI001AF9BD9B|nr:MULTISPECIES: hypothetical protein [Vibrio]CAD7806746.1 hypothetical protein ACOMICROBIO_LMKGKHOH_02177 [Vibrio sp. B1FIG11]CAE6902606.1 hypothetical protein ACOMICROBIO_LMKGKHOH_02177 [Vibrio sp. B1FIG11]
MAISDSNPDRRNLVVLSTSIVLYFLAGGELIDDNVRLQVINVHFNKPEVLVYFVWGLLAWFTYRYWINYKGSWKDGYYTEIGSEISSKICYRYMVKKFSLSDNFERSYYPDRHWLSVSGDGVVKSISFRHIYKLESGQQKSETKSIESPADRFMIFICTVVIFLKEPSLSTYFMPYVFALVAITLGINSSL